MGVLLLLLLLPAAQREARFGVDVVWAGRERGREPRNAWGDPRMNALVSE